MRKLTVVMFVLVAFSFAAAQQDKSKRPSPPATAEVTLAGKKVTVDYSRPKMEDPKTGQVRKIFGGIVPYGQVWRTGANEATTLKTEADLDINGATVPAGTYTLFTLPSEGAWKLIISKKTGEWGIPYPGEKDDLARVDMQKKTLSGSPVDQFTISFDKKTDDAADMHFAWEKTDVWVPVRVKK